MPGRNAVLRAFGPAVEELKPLLRSVLLPRGKHLSEPGDPTSQIIFPVRGLVSSRVIFETDQAMEIVITGRNNAVGILAAVGFPKALTLDVCATETQAWVIQVGDFQAALKRFPMIEEAVRRFGYAQMTYAVRTGTCNAAHSTEQRLARWLLIAEELTERQGIRFSQEELAAIIGAGRTHVNPVLQRFRRDGLIDIGRQRIEILDAETLGLRTCECHELLLEAMRVASPEESIEGAAPRLP